MNVAFIEFHDAELAAASIEAGQLTLALSHVCLYELVEPLRYATWSFTGIVWIRDPRDITLRLAGPLPEEVIDLEIDGLYPDEKSTPKLLAGIPATSVRLALRDGSEGSCKCSLVHFEVGKRGRQQEDWLGPLTAG